MRIVGIARLEWLNDKQRASIAEVLAEELTKEYGSLTPEVGAFALAIDAELAKNKTQAVSALTSYLFEFLEGAVDRLRDAAIDREGVMQEAVEVGALALQIALATGATHEEESA